MKRILFIAFFIAMFVTPIALILFVFDYGCKKSPQEYSLSFIKQLPNTVNLSSLTYNKEDDFLYATQNSPAQLLKIARSGDIIGRAPLPFISDAETIEHIQGNIFAAVDEKTSELFFFTVTKDMHISLRNKIQLEKFNKKNRGFEGLAWKAEGRMLFVAKERRPTGMFAYQLSPDLLSAKQVTIPEELNDIHVKDISGLDFNNESLMILSDESRKLLKFNLTEMSFVEMMDLTKGNHSLTSDLLQPEGIVTLSDESIYVASEPDILAKFVPNK
ncbi:YjiK family protein [Escherichia coli]|nr:YjiK family protein [Escherichia coli]EFF7143656.1 YjiK family protein [Escherichia coli]EGC1636634.1 YjiK family protein [Escherichia coli]EGH5605700.1 YjiK family protein [Escherichia coli]EIH6181183.1 YjiK family protein [Escherichia coli]